MPHGEEHSNALLVDVEGTPLSEIVAAQLVHGYVDDSTNVPDLFVLRFSDDTSKVITDGRFKIGAKVRLKVQTSAPGGTTTLLDGEVTALEAEVGPTGLHTVVRGLDAAHRLYRGNRVEAYVEMTAGDIVRKVAQRNSLRLGKIDARGPVYKHVTQDGVSDWAFLSRLAREIGAVLTVLEGALDFTMPTEAGEAPAGDAGARQDPLVLERSLNLMHLRATVSSADQVPSVEVRGWDVVAKQPVVSTAKATTTHAQLKDGSANPVSIAGLVGGPTYVSWHPSYGQQTRCEGTAKALASHLAGSFASLEGATRGNPELRSGSAVALTGVGAPFDGRYVLTSTRHEFSAEQGYVTSFVVSSDAERSLYGVSAGPHSRTNGHSPLHGVVSAVVSDIKDPDELGRVKLTLPLLNDDYVSGWARTVQAGAGDKRGSVVLPEVGDEVLVAFGPDGADQPYVLGGLFNGKDKPDKAWGDHVGSTDGAVKRRAFSSRTGMVVEMSESPDGERVTVSTNDGKQHLTLAQGPDAAIQVVSEGPVQVTAKADISIETSSGNVTVKGSKIAIEATGDLELKGANVTVTGQAKGELTAPAVKVNGSATAELSGGATTTVRGGLVRIN